MTTPPRWHATPLDDATAAARARQLQVLSDPVRLQVLSAIAAREEGRAHLDSVAAELDLPPTADTWIRFGRLLVVPADPAPLRSRLAQMARPERGLTAELPAVLDRIADRLAYRFSANFSRETVDRYVADSYRLLAERATVPQHLPSLTSRFAADRLSALASLDGRPSRGVPEVLFVCVQNAGRSQIAAAVLRQLAGDRVHVRTAGSRPAEILDQRVVAALDEVGLPVVAEFPKPLTDEVVQAADYVITMGCGDACPLYPGRRYLDWPLPDPVGRPMEEVRGIRDQIAARVEGPLIELGITASAS